MNPLKVRQDPNFDEFRNLHFEELAENKSELFNFFFKMNHVFQKIDEEDMEKLAYQNFNYLDKTFNYTLGSLVGTLIIDQIVLRKAYPGWQIPYLPRPLVFSFKYLAIPLLAFKAAKDYMMPEVERSFKEQADKYNFNYYDYNECMDILERARRVQRMEELIVKGYKDFDWTGVPLIPKEQQKNNQV